MDFSRIVLLSALLTHVSSSPIAAGPMVGRGENRGLPHPPIVTLSPEIDARDDISLFPWVGGCTSTLPRSVVTCSWDGTTTIYPSTTVVYKGLDCGGCSYLDTNNLYQFCPNQKISATKTVATPSTYYTTVCQPSPRTETAAATTVAVTPTSGSGVGPTLSPSPAPSVIITVAPTATVALNARQEVLPAACPTTYVVQPEKSAGKTLTTFSKYTTTTVLLNCGGCPLVISTALAGYGPPGAFTKTTTLPVGTKTAYACK